MDRDMQAILDTLVQAGDDMVEAFAGRLEHIQGLAEVVDKVGDVKVCDGVWLCTAEHMKELDENGTYDGSYYIHTDDGHIEKVL